MDINIDLLKKYYEQFTNNIANYKKMYEYYKGKTDAMSNYKLVTERSNNKTPVNFIKKFIKEEVSYSVGNDITYISKTSDENIINDIDLYTSMWDKKHDIELAKMMLIYSMAYELYYIDTDGNFNCKLIPPTDGFHIIDENNEVVGFMRTFKKPFQNDIFIDLYTENLIYHYDVDFKEIEPSSPHRFSKVPIGLATLSNEGVNDTLYNDLKGLQDAYETNLSDISNEISDFRNAYLCFKGVSIDKSDLPEMKKNGVLEIKNDKGDVKWVIKNINDNFIQNTLGTIEDKIYQLSSHINYNEKMQSNTSSLALRTRLISLEEKCKLNQKSLANCILRRLTFLFEYIKMINNKEYDAKDIKIKFTPNIPQDDLMTAQIINQLGGLLSNETSLSLLSFIDNPKNEMEKSKNDDAGSDF